MVIGLRHKDYYSEEMNETNYEDVLIYLSTINMLIG